MEVELKEDKGKSPFILISSLFLILIVLALIIPFYAVKLDPEPANIVSLEEISSLNFTLNDIDNSVNNKEEFLRFLNANDKVIKSIADSVVVNAECNSVKVCYAKALLYFVRQEIEYVNDPPEEYVKSARETLLSRSGDCDDQTVLLANLMQAVGFETRFVFVPGHVYLESFIPDAPGKYQSKGWVAMDATCEYCELGEVNYKNSKDETVYV